jgi:hypothetical protein
MPYHTPATFGQYGPHDIDIPSYCWRDPEDCWNNQVWPQVKAELERTVHAAAIQKAGPELRAMLEDDGARLKQSVAFMLIAGGAAIVATSWWMGRR